MPPPVPHATFAPPEWQLPFEGSQQPAQWAHAPESPPLLLPPLLLALLLPLPLPLLLLPVPASRRPPLLLELPLLELPLLELPPPLELLPVGGHTMLHVKHVELPQHHT